jgi:hypothetical protein
MTKDNDNEKDDLESLIPVNPNIVRRRGRPKTKKPKTQRKRSKKSQKQEIEGLSSSKINTKMLESDEIDCFQFGKEGEKINPFKDAPSLVYYYRYYLSIKSSESPTFSIYHSDVTYAGKILDDLSEMGKKDNINFLNGWILYYLENHLKGTRISKVDYTAMDQFHKTLSKYKSIAFLD